MFRALRYYQAYDRFKINIVEDIISDKHNKFIEKCIEFEMGRTWILFLNRKQLRTQIQMQSRVKSNLSILFV